MDSEFQFLNPQVIRFDFELNNLFDQEEGQTLNVPSEFHLHVSDIEDIEEMCKVAVLLEVKLGDDEPECPFKIEVAEAALFTWEKRAFSEKRVKSLINHNAPALLLSYIRPMVTNITANSKFPAYQLPLVDFTKVFPLDEEPALEEK